MTDEKWHETIARVKDQFEVLVHDRETFEKEDGGGEVEFIEFQGPMGRMRLERDIHPLVVGTKMIASRRIGSSGHEEKVYSESEMVDKLKAYRWDPGVNDWVPVEGFSSDAF